MNDSLAHRKKKRSLVELQYHYEWQQIRLDGVSIQSYSPIGQKAMEIRDPHHLHVDPLTFTLKERFVILKRYGKGHRTNSFFGMDLYQLRESGLGESLYQEYKEKGYMRL